MTTTPTLSRRATERARDTALLHDLLNPELDLLTVAQKHFKHHHCLRALARWVKARDRRVLLRTLISLADLRANITLTQASQPAAAALLRLTCPDIDAETARKASAELIKSAQKRAQARIVTRPQPTIPARSDADQLEMDAILDAFPRTNAALRLGTGGAA